MNASTFGTDAKYQESLERHNAKYGTDDPIEQGRMIVDAQRAADAQRGRVQVGSIAPTQQRRINVASDKAIDYLVSLSASRTPHVREDVIRIWAGSVDRRVVSDKIDELKDLPVATISDNLAAHLADDVPAPRSVSAGRSLERHNVPAGRYAVDSNEGHTVFVKVDRPTEGQWAGRIFVKVQAGDDLHRTSRDVADALLAKIAADGVQAAMLRYGREIGSCGHCGRTLTNAESREAGIGPVCRGKMGW